MSLLLSGLLLLTAGQAAPPEEGYLPDGRYVEDVAEGDACAAEGRRFFTLVPGDPADPDDHGRIVADFGLGGFDVPLAMVGFTPHVAAGGEVQGIGFIQARTPDDHAYYVSLLLHADGRYAVTQVSDRAPGADLVDRIPMVEDPLPRGVAPDGTPLERFVWCGAE